MRLGRVVLAISVLSGVALCAQTGGAPAAPKASSWRQLRTPDLTVMGSASADELRTTLRGIERFRAAIAMLFPSARMSAPVPTSVIVFRGHVEFSRFQPRDSTGQRLQNVGGYALLAPEANLMVFGSQGVNDLHVVFHEYGHYLFHLNAPNMPVWLDEGLAEFYSTFEPEYKGRSLVGRPPAGRLQAFKHNEFMPLRDVISPRSMEKVWKSPDRITLFYAEAWALVHYVMVERKAPTATPLGTYLKTLAKTNSEDAAFVEAFGVDVETMDKELRKYVVRDAFSGLMTPPVQDSSERAALEPVFETDMHEMQGRVLVHVGAFDDAEKELQTALRLDPAHVAARVSLASLRLSQDRSDEAILLLRGVLETAPNDLSALYFLGTALADQWQPEAAAGLFERAVKVNPSHSASLVGVSASAMAMNQDARALDTLAQALQLDGNAEHYREYSYLALRYGRNDVAAKAAHAYINQVGLAESSGQYEAFVAAIAHWRARQPSEAEDILASAREAIPEGTWTYTILQFLQGGLEADRLLAKAKTIGEQTEAHAYVGFKLDLAGNHNEALVHFRWVASQGAKTYTEYTLVRNELARQLHASAAR